MEQDPAAARKDRTFQASQRAHDIFGAPPSIEARYAAGKALRKRLPREIHGNWAPRQDRPDPVDIIIDSNEGRHPELIPIRHARMLTSSFAFLRGSAAVMAWDLAQTPVTGIRVQVCGDCHLMNFGIFATPERNLVFDINDFDETLPAPWEWDVKRLAASAAVAGRYMGLSDMACRSAAIATVASYCDRMCRYSEMPVLRTWYDRIDIESLFSQINDPDIEKRARARVRGEQKRAIVEHENPKMVTTVAGFPTIKDRPPLIYHHPDQNRDGYYHVLLEGLRLYRKSLSDHHEILFDRFKLRDLAMKVVGIGSVGTSCWIALHTASEGDPLFLQIKQANKSVLEPYAGKSAYRNHGRRVVAGQRLMQSASDIFLGWSVGKLRGLHYYVRQHRDMKMSVTIEALDVAGLQTYAGLCGWALARAHAKSGDPVLISGYIGRGKVFSEAVADFAMRYADQTDIDHRALARAVRDGRIRANDI